MFDKNVLVNIIEDYLKDSPNYLVDIYIGAGNSITVEIDNDNGVDIELSGATTNTITYSACYSGCPDIEILNKVNIDGSIYSFAENDINNRQFVLNKIMHRK